MPNVDCRNVTVTYLHKKGDTTVAVNDFSYCFADGLITVILGQSGCGKSTLLRSIAGLNTFDGQIFVDGKDVDELVLSKRNLAYMSQTFDLLPHLTVYDNLAFPLKSKKMKPDKIDEKVISMARELGILVTLNCKPRQLSIGQQQRVALGRELLKEPDLILFDEPLSNLDPMLREELCILIRRLCSERKATVIYVTHEVKEAVGLADRILLMEKGKLQYSLGKDEFLNSSEPTISSIRIAGGIQ